MIAEIVVAVATIFSLVTAIWPVMVGQNVKCMYIAITVHTVFNCYHVYRGNKDSFIHSIIAHYSYTPLMAWLSGNALVSFNVSILYAGPATSCKLCDQLRVAWI